MYCGSTENLCIDHIIPVSKGGNSNIHNLTRSCISCNTSKSDMMPNKWSDHIEERLINVKKEYDYCLSIFISLSRNHYKINHGS